MAASFFGGEFFGGEFFNETHVRPSGGIPYSGYETRKRTKEEIQRERERLGILPRAAQIINLIAARQVETLKADEQQRLEELTREMALEKIEWESRYLEMLNARRETLISAEIAMLLRKKLQDEENMVILMLLAASA